MSVLRQGRHYLLIGILQWFLDWGVMVRFSFVADAAPTGAPVTLDVTDPGAPAEYAVTSLSVGIPGLLLADGFE